jgi:hypothetical protein
MKYVLISAGLLLLGNADVTAQVSIKGSTMQDFTGKPIMNTKVSEVEGSVFYSEDYKNAQLSLLSGLELADVKVKLNLRHNKVYYLNNAGAEMEAVSKIKRIVFTEDGTVFENGFPAVNEQDAQTYYRVIVSGKASLLLLTSFADVEYKAFNSAVITKQIDRVNEVYGVSPNAITKLTKTDEVMLLLTDKSREVYNFISKNNLKCRKQPDYEKVLSYYNSISN